MVKSRCGQTNWTICRHADCYGRYFKKNAVVDFMTDDLKEEITKAIGGWKQSNFWIEASTRQKIEYLAYFLAARPAQRGILSKFGAVRLARTEGMNLSLIHISEPTRR
eukprot:10191415-Heterocapsa_arctica.AAC.1